MTCRIAHDMPHELSDLPASPELHALAMPRHGRGEIHDLLLDCQRLPGMRMLRVYVPAPELRGDAPLPLLLVNDGHKAFEAANHRAVPPWQQSGTLQLHRVMDGLLCRGAIRPAMVVAIATHASSRADHYVPIRARLGDSEFGGQGDAYLDLLEHEVLPALRRRLRGLSLTENPAERMLAGFSIGGFAALYGALARPDVFGAALALSPSAWVDEGWLTRFAEERERCDARIAADVGSGEGEPIRDHCGQLFEVLKRRCGDRVLAEQIDGTHHEDSWRARLPRLLQHLLGQA
ncbi:MAG: hypothetical protein H6835_02910 [Planctomycetes bacterium]|nr:hypothetical protein [Planctomycetota bacterium]